MELRLFRRSDFASAVICLLGFCLCGARFLQAQQPCLKRAWEAFNKRDYENAVAAAEVCIDDFGPRAQKQQAMLVTKWNCSKDFFGIVPNPADREKIFQNWAVNDVSAACWIKGRSAEYLGKRNVRADRYRKIAEQGYEEAGKLSCGRVWDPQGWFWSPAEAASERLPVKWE